MTLHVDDGTWRTKVVR